MTTESKIEVKCPIKDKAFADVGLLFHGKMAVPGKRVILECEIPEDAESILDLPSSRTKKNRKLYL